MIRKRKLYVRPKKAYESARIKEENELLKKYALKNKREVWKTRAKVDYFRKRAMALSKSSFEEQEVLFNKLRSLGIKIDSIADILALKIEDLLNHRLPTIVHSKGLAKTPQQARQLVVHKKVAINGNIINIPSYLVPVSEEKHITIKAKEAKAKPKEVPKEAEVKQWPKKN